MGVEEAQKKSLATEVARLRMNGPLSKYGKCCETPVSRHSLYF